MKFNELQLVFSPNKAETKAQNYFKGFQ